MIDAGTGYSGWHTIKVTRDSSGSWELFVDDVSKGTAVDNTYTQLPYICIGRYGGFDNILVQVGYYIANLHTKELGLPTGEYLITVWLQGQTIQVGSYSFELQEQAARGKGPNK